MPSRPTSVGSHHVLENSAGSLSVQLIDYGATVTKIFAPDYQGQLADVLLGCPSDESYLQPHPHFNCLVGRYANRITSARFELDGVEYALDANIPPHQLHGGRRGFANRLWTSKTGQDEVSFALTSADGDAGFPGELNVTATYSITGTTLRLHISAETTKPTPISITAHQYFNLSGIQGSSIHDHVLQIYADRYLAVSNELTQLGEFRDVQHSPFDFRTPKPIGTHIDADHEQIQLAGGYDHNFVINGSGLRVAARLTHPASKRCLTVRTNQPGMQLYTCNTLAAQGKDGVTYGKHQGVCLETQQFPDAPNHPNYPNAILRLGERWEGITEYEFSTT